MPQIPTKREGESNLLGRSPMMIDVGKLGQGKNYWFPTKVSIVLTLYFSNVLTCRGEKGLDLNDIFIWEKLEAFPLFPSRRSIQ